MTTHTRTRRISVPAYYLGRPAALWLAAFAPRSTTHKITSRVVRQPYGAAGLRAPDIVDR